MNGIFFEEFARKNWEANFNKSGLTINEKNTLQYTRDLKRIKAQMINAIKDKDKEILQAKNENSRLKVISKELREVKKYKESSLLILKKVKNLNK